LCFAFGSKEFALTTTMRLAKPVLKFKGIYKYTAEE